MSISAFFENKRNRLWIKQLTVFVTFAGASFSLLTWLGTLLRPKLSAIFPQWYAPTPQPREQVFYAIIAFAIGVIALAFELRYFWRLFDFFGFGEGLNLLFVLPTFRPVDIRAYKDVRKGDTIVRKDKTLRAGPTYGHHNFDTVFRAMKRVSELRYTNLYFETDEKVMPIEDREPSGSHVDERTVVCLGSNSSNNLTTYLMDQYPFNEQPFFFRFDDSRGFDAVTRHTGFTLRREGVVKDHPTLARELIDTANLDFAILLRHTTDFTTYFLCAGLDTAGSESNVEYLFASWPKIARWSEGRDFYSVAKVNKQSKHGIPLLRAVREKNNRRYDLIFVSPELEQSNV